MQNLKSYFPLGEYYKPTKRFTSNDAYVAGLRINEFSWYLGIVADLSQKKATIVADRSHFERAMDLRTGSKLCWECESLQVELVEGVAWLLAFDSSDSVTINSYAPMSLLAHVSPYKRPAKFPVVDIHAHIDFEEMHAEKLELFNELNIAMVINSPFEVLTYHRKEERKSQDTSISCYQYAPDLKNIRLPERRDEIVAAIESGAENNEFVGIGEFHDKGLGVTAQQFITDPYAALFFDDPWLDPIWEAASKYELPVLMHLGAETFQYLPPDRSNEGIVDLLQNPWYTINTKKAISKKELRSKRNRLLKRFPNLRLVMAHMDCCADDLRQLDKTLCDNPGIVLDIGDSFEWIGRQPRASSIFFEKHQDRILFGGDQAQSSEHYYFQFRVLESTDEGFYPPAGMMFPHIPNYGLGLQDKILRKVYYDNALSVYPRLGCKANDRIERLLKNSQEDEAL